MTGCHTGGHSIIMIPTAAILIKYNDTIICIITLTLLVTATINNHNATNIVMLTLTLLVMAAINNHNDTSIVIMTLTLSVVITAILINYNGTNIMYNDTC